MLLSSLIPTKQRRESLDTTQPQNEILTARELEVLKLIARGHKNREIAQALQIEERTVRFHAANILHKLKITNRAEARCFACKNGWLND